MIQGKISNTLKFLLFFNILIYLLFTLYTFATPASNITNSVLINLFGTFEARSVLNGGIWLLITSAFLHFQFYHILFNGFALLQIGRLIENFYSERKLIITYIFSGLVGNIFTLIYAILVDNLTLSSIGASGAVFGLLGLLVGGTFQKSRFGGNLPFDTQDFLPTLVLAAVMSFLPGINWMAHLGGFVTGFIFSYIFKHIFVASDLRESKIENTLFYTSLAIFVISYALLIFNLLFDFVNI